MKSIASEALAAMHGVALPIAAIGVPGIVFGAVVGFVVMTTWGFRRVRATSRERPVG